MIARRTAERLPALFLAFTGCGAAAAASLTVNIDGIEGEMQQAARTNLALDEYTKREVTAAQIRSLVSGGDAQIRKALEPFGYYNVRITKELKENGDKFTAQFHVTLGDPVLVRKSAISVTGEAQSVDRIQRAVSRFRPAVGERLDHA